MRQFLKPKEAAAIIGVHVHTLEKWRRLGRGPTYYQLSSRTVRYAEDDVRSFAKDRQEKRRAAANAEHALLPRIRELIEGGYSFQQIGDRLGISRQRAHQILRKAGPK